MTLKQIYSAVKKKRGRDKILASILVELPDSQDNHILAKIVFVRDRNHKRNWLALLSTDTNLEDDESYGFTANAGILRFFFKINKSYLGLAKEFQERSYDMMIADTTIVFTRYIMLALEPEKARIIELLAAYFTNAAMNWKTLNSATR